MYLEKTVYNHNNLIFSKMINSYSCELQISMVCYCGCMLILMIIKLYDYVNDDILAISIVVCMNVNVCLHRA